MSDGSLRRLSRRVMIRAMRFPAAENGVVMTEFVIAAPLFLFMVLGSMQFMSISHADAMLHYANFMATRAGAVHYENYKRGWDTSESGSGWQNKLRNKMEKTVAHAMGPFVDTEHHYKEHGVNGRPYPLVGAAVLPSPLGPLGDPMIFTNFGELDLGNGAPYLQKWIVVQTEVWLGLYYPYVGQAIAALHNRLQTVTPLSVYHMDELTWAKSGFDSFAEPNAAAIAVLQAQEAAFDAPYIFVRSDALMDHRTEESQDRWIPWPLQGRTIQNATASSLSSTDYTKNAQPHVYPIQSRFPNP